MRRLYPSCGGGHQGGAEVGQHLAVLDVAAGLGGVQHAGPGDEADVVHLRARPGEEVQVAPLGGIHLDRLQRGLLVGRAPRHPDPEPPVHRVPDARAVQPVRRGAAPQVLQAEELGGQPEPFRRGAGYADRPHGALVEPAVRAVRQRDPDPPAGPVDDREHGGEGQLRDHAAGLVVQRGVRDVDRDRVGGGARELAEVRRRDPARVAGLVGRGRLPRGNDLGPAVALGPDQHGFAEQQLGEGAAVQAEPGLVVEGFGPGGGVGLRGDRGGVGRAGRVGGGPQRADGHSEGGEAHAINPVTPRPGPAGSRSVGPSYRMPPSTTGFASHQAASRSGTTVVGWAATSAAAAPTPTWVSIIVPTTVPSSCARATSSSVRATPSPPHLATLTFTRSAAPRRITSTRSRTPYTDSSARIGVLTRSRTQAIPSRSAAATGCSTSSTSQPASSSPRITWTAVRGDQPWFASRRITGSGPIACRTAFTRATSVIASPVPTLSLSTSKPSATRRSACGQLDSPLDTVTSVRTLVATAPR